MIVCCCKFFFIVQVADNNDKSFHGYVFVKLKNYFPNKNVIDEQSKRPVNYKNL